jgi:hypothetical protein
MVSRRLRASASPTKSEAFCVHRSPTDSATRPYGGSCWEAPFTGGVTIYAFYAMQPYLLELYGNQRAFAIAGLDTVDALSLARPPRIGGQRSRRRVAATVTLE